MAAGSNTNQTYKGLIITDEPLLCSTDNADQQPLEQVLNTHFKGSVSFTSTTRDRFLEQPDLEPSFFLVDVTNKQDNGLKTLEYLSAKIPSFKRPFALIDFDSVLRAEADKYNAVSLDKPIRSSQVINDIGERTALFNSSFFDPLTGLYNRLALQDDLTREFYSFLRGSRSNTDNHLSAIMVDGDFFKHINDNYGHPQGDDAIRMLAYCIKSQLHRPTDIVARVGGEEFFILLPGVDLSGAQTIAENIRKTIETTCMMPYKQDRVIIDSMAAKPYKLDDSGQPIRTFPQMTVSLGIAEMSREMKVPTDLYAAADQNLYAAKQQRNTIFPPKPLEHSPL